MSDEADADHWPMVPQEDRCEWCGGDLFSAQQCRNPAHDPLTGTTPACAECGRCLHLSHQRGQEGVAP